MEAAVPDESGDWPTTCENALDQKFSSREDLGRWTDYAGRIARRIRRPDLADDAVQESYIRLHSRCTRAERPEDLGPGWPSDAYIFRTIRNTLFDLAGGRVHAELSPETPDPADIDDELDAQFERDRVHQRAVDTVHALGLLGEDLGVQAIYVARRCVNDVDTVALPVHFRAPTRYDAALYEALAYIDPKLAQTPLDREAYRVRMQRAKRTLKRRLRDFKDMMGGDLAD